METPRKRLRPVVVATRLNEVEAAQLDALRGALSRAEYLRWLFVEARKRSETGQ